MSSEPNDHPDAATPPAWVLRVGRTSWAFLGFAGAVAVVVIVLGTLRSVVIPLVVAAFLAVVLAPLVDWFAARRIPRAIGALLVIAMVFAVVLGAIAIVVFGVANRADQLTAAFDDARDQINDLVQRWDLDGIVDTIRERTGESGGLVGEGLGERVGSILGTAAGFAAGLVLGVVLLYYLLKDGSSLVRSGIRRRSVASAAQADRIVAQAAASIRGYVKGRSLLALVQGAAVALALWILDVPLAGSVGVVNFIGAYIPYFGAFVGGTFAVLMGLAGGGATMALLALVVVLFVNLVLENLLEPKLVGSTLQLHPVVVLISTVAGGLLLGMVGLILASPTVAIGLNLARELRDSGFFGTPPAAEAGPEGKPIGSEDTEAAPGTTEAGPADESP